MGESQNERAVINAQTKSSNASRKTSEIIAILCQLPNSNNGLTHN
jgi:hypothetical protein